jgi:hypothetical protein
VTRLGQTIPAMPVRDAAAAIAFYRHRFDDVLHRVSRDGVDDTDYGTREFATLDLDGTLIRFFQWVEHR